MNFTVKRIPIAEGNIWDVTCDHPFSLTFEHETWESHPSGILDHIQFRAHDDISPFVVHIEGWAIEVRREVGR